MNCFIYLMDGTQTGTANQGQSGPQSNGNVVVHSELQDWSIIISCSLESYIRTFIRGSYLSAEVPSEYFTAPHLGKAVSQVVLFEIMFEMIVNCINKVSKVGDHSQGDPKAPFSIASTPRCRGGRYSFPWIAPLYP